MRPDQMRVYELCEQMQEEVDKLLSTLPAEARKIADHLERSSESAGLNLEEGLVAYKPKVKASYFDICRRESSEVRKCLRRLITKRFVKQASDTYPADKKANALIATMVNMIKQQEVRAIKEGD